MRDKDYVLKRPRNTYRIALVGSSFSMGGGVPESQTFEALLEERLTRGVQDRAYRRVEILNFSVMSYSVLQELITVERKVFRFEPQALLVMIHSVEINRMTSHLVTLVREGTPITHPYVQQKLREAGVRMGMEEPELRRRIFPIANDLTRWSYQRMVQLAKQNGVSILGVAFPIPQERNPDRLAAVVAIASAAGIPIVSLEAAYGRHRVKDLRLDRDRRDPHLSVLGHRVVADELYRILRDRDSSALGVDLVSAGPYFPPTAIRPTQSN